MKLPRHSLVGLLVAAALMVGGCVGRPSPETAPAPGNGASPPPVVGPSTETSPERMGAVKIKITLEDKVLTATMVDSSAARDFIALLPLTLTLEDYAGTEKVIGLPSKLSMQDAPSGSDPAVGDIAYYAPWGNLAIFYRDFGYSSGLVILGKLDREPEAFRVTGNVRVKIERME